MTEAELQIAEAEYYRIKGAGLLEGPISIGDKLIWEPGRPNAYTRITVNNVTDNGEEIWIEAIDEHGGLSWNEETRVREACIRDN